ncbi:hypothetical protein EDD18DRAFT_1107524 [Armillaria luteobubalina]|uniref:Uncharacterized protein n=1 Tax=Armillaria luteobubalina TaxID=153913 RepID=A0AA39Q269_9AGAR|nr:hypothetical protein EDD18DRAFT_1107524 [Armillaria luteobubalina]
MRDTQYTRGQCTPSTPKLFDIGITRKFIYLKAEGMIIDYPSTPVNWYTANLIGLQGVQDMRYSLSSLQSPGQMILHLLQSTNRNALSKNINQLPQENHSAMVRPVQFQDGRAPSNVLANKISVSEFSRKLMRVGSLRDCGTGANDESRQWGVQRGAQFSNSAWLKVLAIVILHRPPGSWLHNDAERESFLLKPARSSNRLTDIAEPAPRYTTSKHGCSPSNILQTY